MKLRNKIYLGIIGVIALFGFLGSISSHQQVAGVQSEAPTIAKTQAPTITKAPTITPIPTHIPTPTPTKAPVNPVYNYVAPTTPPASTTDNSSVQNAQTGSSSQACSGATALCNDGTCSYAAHHQGACSHHGGVAQFYQ